VTYREIARAERQHHVALADAYQRHADALRDMDYALLVALEMLHHPDDLPAALEHLRETRRELADHRELVEVELWHEQVESALDPDVRPLLAKM
jgi:uncharacterized membrane protein YcjF (UPF0283 family)